MSYRYLDEIFEEIAVMAADIPGEDERAIELAKDIMARHGLCPKERNYLCNRISEDLGLTINSL